LFTPLIATVILGWSPNQTKLPAEHQIIKPGSPPRGNLTEFRRASTSLPTNENLLPNGKGYKRIGQKSQISKDRRKIVEQRIGIHLKGPLRNILKNTRLKKLLEKIKCNVFQTFFFHSIEIIWVSGNLIRNSPEKQTTINKESCSRFRIKWFSSLLVLELVVGFLKPPAEDWITKWGSLVATTASTLLAPTFKPKVRNTGPAYVLPDVSSGRCCLFHLRTVTQFRWALIDWGPLLFFFLVKKRHV